MVRTALYEQRQKRRRNDGDHRKPYCAFEHFQSGQHTAHCVGDCPSHNGHAAAQQKFPGFQRECIRALRKYPLQADERAEHRGAKREQPLRPSAYGGGQLRKVQRTAYGRSSIQRQQHTRERQPHSAQNICHNHRRTEEKATVQRRAAYLSAGCQHRSEHRNKRNDINAACFDCILQYTGERQHAGRTEREHSQRDNSIHKAREFRRRSLGAHAFSHGRQQQQAAQPCQ